MSREEKKQGRQERYRALVERIEPRTKYARAVSCVRLQESDIADDKWVDIVEMDTEKDMKEEEFQFSHIVFNTYKRITNPVYPSRDVFEDTPEGEKEYRDACNEATVKAARQDINNQSVPLGSYELTGRLTDELNTYASRVKKLSEKPKNQGYLEGIVKIERAEDRYADKYEQSNGAQRRYKKYWEY